MFRFVALLFGFNLLLCLNISAQSNSTSVTITNINPLPVSTQTDDKPQSKVWYYEGKWWAVLSDLNGTHVWRLDDKIWKDVLLISDLKYSKADCKVVNGVVHILLFRREYKTYIVSVEYDPSLKNYKMWSNRSLNVSLTLDAGAETATMEVDGNGRMWIASDGSKTVNVRWSDSPYAVWSSPITLAYGIKTDDICAVVAMPGKVGVLWTNQNTKRFGFRTHTDGASPNSWSADEIPASQSALNVGLGMADDHLNLALSSNGTLYCAIKTGYETAGYPKLALLVRRPTGTWDKLYEVTQNEGTRPIVVLNEVLGILKVIYTSTESGGNILYSQASTTCLKFGPPATLLSGNYNYPTSMKQNYASEVLILATDLKVSPLQVVGVLLKDEARPDNVPVVCEVEDNEKLKPIAFPNPFENITTIMFSLPEGEAYVMTLYDARGAKIAAEISNVSVAGGVNKITLDGTNLDSGLYIARLQSNSGLQFVKLILER